MWAPEPYYDVIGANPDTGEFMIGAICETRMYHLFTKIDRDVKAVKELDKVREACDTLGVDHKRCRFDKKWRHRSGLWEGYGSMCEHLEWMSQVKEKTEASLAKFKADLEDAGAYSDVLMAARKAELEAFYIRMGETSRLDAERLLIDEKVRRLARDRRLADK